MRNNIHKRSNEFFENFNQIGFQVSDSVFKSILKRRPIKIHQNLKELKQSQTKVLNLDKDTNELLIPDNREIRATEMFKVSNLNMIDESEIHFKL